MFEQIDFEPFKKAFLENESELQAIGDAQRAMNHLLVSLCKIVLQNRLKRHLPFAAPLGARRIFLYVWREFYGVDSFLRARM